MPFGGLLTVGIISAAASLGGAAIGANAAGDAADSQEEAARRVQALAEAQKRSSDSSFGDILLHSGSLVDDAKRAAQGDAERGTASASVILDAERQAAERQAQYERENASRLTRPYTDAGITSLADAQAISKGPAFTAANFKELDPGFDFRISEGQKALERSAFAKGSGLSGATLKAITRYSQDYGAGEFGAAFDRFERARQTNYNMAMGIVGTGQTATGQDLVAGQNSVENRTRAGALFAAPQAVNAVNLGNRLGDLTMNTSQFNANMEFAVRKAQQDAALDALGIQGNAITGGANARAAGTVGAGNAWSGGISGATNSITDAIMLQQLFARQPVVSSGTPPPMPAMPLYQVTPPPAPYVPAAP